MASKEFVENFALVTRWHGLLPDEVEAFKVLCRGNMDAAEVMLALVASRLKQHPAYGINERIKAGKGTGGSAEGGDPPAPGDEVVAP